MTARRLYPQYVGVDYRESVGAALDMALALISDEAHWAKSVLSVDEYGVQVEPCAPDAMRWCAIGAVYRGAADGGKTGKYGGVFTTQLVRKFAEHELNKAAMELYGYTIAFINDGRGELSIGEYAHDSVVACYHRAIANVAQGGEQR